jgi:hypothetical protein
MSVVLFNEMSGLMDLSKSESCFIDLSYEGDFENESKEILEDVSKVKIDHLLNICEDKSIQGDRELFTKWHISTPYLEIHSPPPDVLA